MPLQTYNLKLYDVFGRFVCALPDYAEDLFRLRENLRPLVREIAEKRGQTDFTVEVTNPSKPGGRITRRVQFTFYDSIVPRTPRHPVEGRATIEDSDLLPSQKGALTRTAGLYYLDEVTEYSEAEIRRLPHFSGDAAVVRLKAALAREGLFLNVPAGVADTDADAVIAAAPAGRDDAAARVRTLIEMAERELDRTRGADGRKLLRGRLSMLRWELATLYGNDGDAMASVAEKYRNSR